MFDILQYSFMVRAFEAGLVVALIAPLIGIFLVLRRYSLIADTLAHISLAGISVGLLTGLNPVFSATIAAVTSSFGIERLRNSRRIYGESALALFLSGSLALSTIILSYGNGLNANLFKYLFGSITTVTQIEIYIIMILAFVVVIVLTLFFKELIYITFDEESARVSGLPVKFLDVVFIVLSALTISIAIPVVGILLISALIVIPVIAALQLQKSFSQTILYAEVISVGSVFSGILLSFYCNLSTGGTIVLVMVACFLVIYAMKGGKAGLA